MEIEIATDPEIGTEFESPKPHVRYFFRKMPHAIGASNGALVDFVYVEYHRDGTVHGRPISHAELQMKGAPV